MTDTIQFKRRINGATGSPGAGGAKEGEVAFNAPGAAGATTKPIMYFFDGTAWRTVNPDVTVTTQSVNLGTTGSGPGAGFTASGAVISGNVVIGTWGSPAQAYVLTNTAAPGVDASWTSLGGAVSFAVAADIITGTDTTKALNSSALRGATVVTSAGAGDANKIPRLDATGKLDSSVLPVIAAEVKGSTDPTAQAPAGSQTGDIWFASKAGTAHTSFAGLTGTAIGIGDALIFDGTNWHAVPNMVDLSAYVPLAGTNLMTGNIVWSGAANNKAGTVIFDGKGGTIDNVLLDCGTY